MLIVKIDHREKVLHPFQDCWNSLDLINISRENLHIGDIQYWLDDRMVLCVERKTFPDLADSIKDGRYREQKFRLLEHTDPSQILYLLEGELPRQHEKIHGLTWKTIMGVVLNLQYRDGIKVITSLQPKDSVQILIMIAKRILEGKCNNTNQNTVSQNYHHVVSLSKKTHLNPDNCYRLQLAQIPGISYGIADKIASIYPTLVSLIDELRQHGLVNLENIPVGDPSKKITTSTGKIRQTTRIGKKRANQISKFLGF